MQIKLEYSITQCTKINSKLIKELNVRPETINLLDENIGSKLFDIGLVIFFRICLLRQGKQKQKSANESTSN